jgi:hypothetical protein
MLLAQCKLFYVKEIAWKYVDVCGKLNVCLTCTSFQVDFDSPERLFTKKESLSSTNNDQVLFIYCLHVFLVLCDCLFGFLSSLTVFYLF